MAAFALAFSAVQDPTTGLFVTLTDTSNWSDNDENYSEAEFARNFILTDYLGNAIITIPLPTGEESITWQVPPGTNPWVNIDYNVVGPVTIDKIEKFPFQRIYELAFINAIKGKCGCNTALSPNLCEVDNFYQGAAMAAPIADAINYQNNINSAYAYLTAPL